MAKERIYSGKNKVFTGSKYNSGTGQLKLSRKSMNKKGFFSQFNTPKIKKYPPGTQVKISGGGKDSKGDYIEVETNKK